MQEEAALVSNIEYSSCNTPDGGLLHIYNGNEQIPLHTGKPVVDDTL